MDIMDICSICFTEQEEFENHHVIWRTNGGTDDPINLLKVCKTCHAIISFGNSEDATPRNAACIYHQLGQYGLTFFLKSGACLAKTRWVANS